MDKKTTVFESLLSVLPAFLAFAVPVFFLPLTTEFFEFNKLVLVSVGTGLMLLVWVMKMISEKKVEVIKSPVDPVLILSVLAVILSTVFSINKYTSLFGAQGRWFPSLFGIVVLFVFYYVSSTNINNMRTVKMVSLALLIGISISSLVALLGYFSVPLGSAQYLQIPNFTLTGSTLIATILASVGVVLSFGTILSNGTSSLKMFGVVSFVLNFLAVLLMGTLPSWVALGVGMLVAFYQSDVKKVIENKSFFGILAAVIFGLTLLMLLPNSRAVLVNSDYPKEVRISARESWIVVSSIIRDFPILGTGPSSFGLNYTRYKPLSVNDENYWNVRFDKPYSEAFGVIGAFGLVGVIVSLVLFLKSLKFALDSKNSVDQGGLYPALVGSFVALLFVLLVNYSTVATAFIMALLFVLITVKNKLESTNNVSAVQLSISSFAKGSGMSLAGTGGEKEVFQYIIALPIVALTVVGGLNMYREFSGEYYMRQAINAAQENDGALTYSMQQRAININPRRDMYQNSYANTNLALATTLSARENLTAEEKATIQSLISQAIRSSRVSTEVLNPLNPTNWETRANIYRSLIGVANDASSWAVRSYNTAIQLDPSNPRLRLVLGGVYYSTGDYLSAANLFNQATTLKPDYANAHYNLAQALKMLQNYPQAQKELELVSRLVDSDSPDGIKVAAELEELSKLPTVAGATTQPTVAEITGTTEEPTRQEPISNVGDTPKVDGVQNVELGNTQQQQTNPTPEQPVNNGNTENR